MVTATRPPSTISIDRKSYSIQRDLQASTGSAAEVLRNIPSVSVDVDGNPSLRGDANVQILINGRPSPEFNNANRGAALQQLGADGIARVEVMTTPPANFKPDGSAGIINIITKQSGDSRTLTGQASVGSAGRFNIASSGAIQEGKLNLHASLTLRRDVRDRTTRNDRLVIDPTGTAPSVPSTEDTELVSRKLSEVLSGGADLDLTSRDELSLSGTYNHRAGDASLHETEVEYGASGLPDSEEYVSRPTGLSHVNTDVSLHFTHKIDADGDGLTAFVQQSETVEHSGLHYLFSPQLPPQPTSMEFQDENSDEQVREANVELTSKVKLFGKITSGYDLQVDRDRYANDQTLPFLMGEPPELDAGAINDFKEKQVINAWYASDEKKLGKLTILAGLRFEDTHLDTLLITNNEPGRQAYARLYPSLHLDYKVASNQSLSLGYSRRIIRPDADDLNPYLIQRSPTEFVRGSPDLQPQDIQSLEAGWSHQHGQETESVTLYGKNIHNDFTRVITPLSPTTFLGVEANIGKSLLTGLELVAARSLTKQLSFSTSGNIYYNTIDSSNLGFTDTRSSPGYDWKGSLDYRPTSRDSIQLNANASGRTLTPQGYERGYISLDAGYRHDLTPTSALTLTVTDIFDSRREGLILDSGYTRETTSQRLSGRVVSLAITWSLSGVLSKAARKFDYEGAS